MDPRHTAGLKSPRGFGRRRLYAAGAAVVAFFAFDLSRPPAAQWTAQAELAAIARYRSTLSPLVGRAGVVCRFETSCSRYAEIVIRADGALVGTARALWRVARCGPWTPPGTRDLSGEDAQVGSPRPPG